MTRPTPHEPEYRYESAGFTNPAVQIGLDRLYLRIVGGLDGVQSICDLGCGNGRLAHEMARKGYRVVGVDRSPSGIALASNEHGAHTVSFECAAIDHDLPQRLLATSPPFDAVVSSDVIEHMYCPRALVEAAHAILRPGGYLVLGTPYHGYLKNLAIAVSNKWDAHHTVDWDGGHIKFFSVKTLSRLVAESGLEILRFHFFGRVPWLWKNMVCVARRND